MPSRRSVLQLLGLAPVAGPLAAKAATDAAIAEAVGISKIASGSGPEFLTGAGSINAAPLQSNEANWQSKVFAFLRQGAIPHWAEEKIRAECRYVPCLDPDIANKRSWSMAVKIQTQRERNVARAMADIRERPRREMLRNKFAKKWGVWI